MVRGIVVSQLATGILLALTALSSDPAWCIVFFCGYSAAQWISSPAMYTLLMNNVVEADRAGASALIMFSNFLLTAVATSAMGILLLHLGYPVMYDRTRRPRVHPRIRLLVDDCRTPFPDAEPGKRCAAESSMD